MGVKKRATDSSANHGFGNRAVIVICVICLFIVVGVITASVGDWSVSVNSSSVHTREELIEIVHAPLVENEPYERDSLRKRSLRTSFAAVAPASSLKCTASQAASLAEVFRTAFNRLGAPRIVLVECLG